MLRKAFLKRLVAVPNASADNKKDLLVLDKKEVYVGRRKDCDLVFQEKIISRKHVVFRFEDSHWRIECLNATNGVCLNGEPLNKNEVRKLPNNCVISFGPNYLTDFLYQFTIEPSAGDRSVMGKIDLSKVKREVSVADELKPKMVASPLPSKRRRSIKSESIEIDELEANKTKLIQLNSRIEHLEQKLQRYRSQRKEAQRKSRKQMKQMKSLQVLNVRQKTIIRNARSNLSKERMKRKELQRQLDEKQRQLDEKKDQLQLSKKESADLESLRKVDTWHSGCTAPASPTDLATFSQIVRKYNEMFSEDFTCGICLELFIEPVTLTCGHTTCKFCVNEWFKRNQNKRECPLCRTGIRMSWYKNVLIENVIDKYLLSAHQEVLDTRKRLIEERAKVVEKSKAEEAANPPEHRHRHRHMFFEGANPLIEFFGGGNNAINYHDLSINDLSDEGTSNDDDDEEELMEDIQFLDDEYDEEFDEEEDEEGIDAIVLDDDPNDV